MPDKDGYPTKKELRAFRQWRCPSTNASWGSPHVIIEHLQAIWWNPDWGFKLCRGRDTLFKRWVIRLELHTGGWSGNEDIITELGTTWFWLLFWQKSTRGGHYSFEIPWDVWKQKK